MIYSKYIYIYVDITDSNPNANTNASLRKIGHDAVTNRGGANRN